MTAPPPQQHPTPPSAASVSSHTFSPAPPTPSSASASPTQAYMNTETANQPQVADKAYTQRNMKSAKQEQKQDTGQGQGGQYHTFSQHQPQQAQTQQTQQAQPPPQPQQYPPNQPPTSQQQSQPQQKKVPAYPHPHSQPQPTNASYQTPPRNPLHPSIVPLLSQDFISLYNSTLQHWPPPPTDLQTIRANYSSLYRFAGRPASGVGGIGETTVPGWAKYGSLTTGLADGVGGGVNGASAGGSAGAEVRVRVYVPPGDLDGVAPGVRVGKKLQATDESDKAGGDGEGEANDGRWEGKEKGERGVWPVHFNFHGGGWAVGDLETSAHLCHHICAAVPCTVIDIEYRLIPEYPFPIGIMDALSAVLHILINHKTFSIDPTNFTLGGESSGATIALILNHILRDAGMGEHLKGVVAGTPTISDVKKYATPNMSPWPSMRESMYTPLLNWEKLKWFDTFKWMSLSSNHPGVSAKEMRKDVSWFADAMDAPDFKGLAGVTWVGTAEADPLRDEAEAYAEKVRGAGNTVVLKRYKGMPHGFMRLDAVLEEAREFVDDVVRVVRGCLYEGAERRGPGDEKGEGEEGKMEVEDDGKAEGGEGTEERDERDGDLREKEEKEEEKEEGKQEEMQKEDEVMSDAPDR